MGKDGKMRRRCMRKCPDGQYRNMQNKCATIKRRKVCGGADLIGGEAGYESSESVSGL
jgi:hypothetical protein